MTVQSGRITFIIRIACVVAYLLILGGGVVIAEDMAGYRVVFVPPVYYVGDEVELRVTFRSPLGRTIEVPKTLPEAPWGELRAASLFQKDDVFELRLKFVAFAPGTQPIPPIRLGAVTIDGLSLHVTSLVVSEDQEPRGPRPQATVSGTPILIVIQVFLVLLVPALVLVGRRFGPSWVRFLYRRWRERLPGKRLSKGLAGLRAELSQQDARQVYIRLLDEARAYLTDRLEVQAMSATTQELEGALRRALATEPAIAEGLIDLFRQGEKVKFGHQAASPALQKSDIDHLERLVVSIEANRRKRPEKTQETRLVDA